jgi:hypothetical protein
MIVLGYLLALFAGAGVLRLVAGTRPHRAYGWVGAAALSVLAGGAVVALVTTVVAVLGRSIRPWPFVAPVLVLLGLALAWPDPVRPVGRPGWRSRLGDVLVGGLGLAVGVRLATATAGLTVASNDEYAIWMARARTLSLAGRLDPAVFLGARASYQHLDYPLLVPAVAAWGDGWIRHASDAAAHVALSVTLGAALAVAGWALLRLAGAAAAVAGMLLLAATPQLLAPAALLLTADATVFAFAVSAALVMAVWVRDGGRAPLGAAAVLAAGAAQTKVEGMLFAAAMLVAAAVAVKSGRRRALVPAAAGVLGTVLPWLLWTRLHGLPSDVLNAGTLAPGHLVRTLPLAGEVGRQMAAYWPGFGLGFLLALAPAGWLAWRAGHGRLTAYVGVTLALVALGLYAQYLVGAAPPWARGAAAFPSLRLHFASTGHRVLLVPAALASVGVPLLAGSALRRTVPGTDDGPPEPVPPSPVSPAAPGGTRA